MRIQDAYKLIHQASLGAGHAVASLEMARQWIQRELAEMGDGPAEPVLDPISPDGEIVRIHLRPYAARGGDPEALLTAFFRTANEFTGKIQTLKDGLEILAGLRQFPAVEMHEFAQTIRAQGYPAVHHSPEYSRLYRPAYRVIWREQISWSG